MAAVSAATGIGLSWPSKLTTTSIEKRPRWMTSPSTKTFTLKKSEDAFNKAKENFNFFTRRKARRALRMTQSKAYCASGFLLQPVIEMSASELTNFGEPYYGNGIAEIATSSTTEMSNAASSVVENVPLIDLDPATAKTLIPFLGPFLSAFAFLFILRIVMSWYPKLPVEKFPYIVAYAPTEPLLIPTRKVIPPLGGVDVTPVVWFGLISFLNEILVGPQGLLVLLSQKI